MTALDDVDLDALVRLRVSDVEHLKHTIDRIRRSSPRSAKVIGTKTLIVLGRSTGTHARP